MTVDSGSACVPEWTFGDRIRKARITAGMDQRQFAAAIDAKPGSVAQWETDRARPRDVVAVAKRIEVLTRIPAGWTLGVETGGGNGPTGGPGAAADKSRCCDSRDHSADIVCFPPVDAPRRIAAA
jgi:transcriptional regulator with XRE-family HTH domain